MMKTNSTLQVGVLYVTIHCPR